MAGAILGGIKRYLAQNPPLARETASPDELGRDGSLARMRRARCRRRGRRSRAARCSIAVASSAVTGREKR